VVPDANVTVPLPLHEPSRLAILSLLGTSALTTGGSPLKLIAATIEKAATSAIR
jgi:hypothetical protein